MITVDALLQSYAAYLRAKVQLAEFSTFGGGIADNCRRTIADHEALEARYLVQLADRRRAADAQFRKKMGD